MICEETGGTVRGRKGERFSSKDHCQERLKVAEWREERKPGSVAAARALAQGGPCSGYWYAGVHVCM